MTDLADPDRVVRLDRVSKRFQPDVTALDQVSLDVAHGEIVTLLGSSGSGKSTLLRHVNGLQRATSGTVTTLGHDTGRASGTQLRQLRRRIGFIFQHFHLVSTLTLLENVCTGALGGLRGPRLGLPTYPRPVRADAMRSLERVGLADHAFQRAETLSGGQQQRAAVARALMQDPEILLADEPVASLDPNSAMQVMNLIRDICTEQRLTVLCSLHQPDLALRWAERVVGLRHGQVVLDAPAERLTMQQAMTVYTTSSPSP